MTSKPILRPEALSEQAEKLANEMAQLTLNMHPTVTLLAAVWVLRSTAMIYHQEETALDFLLDAVNRISLALPEKTAAHRLH